MLNLILHVLVTQMYADLTELLIKYKREKQTLLDTAK